MQGKLHTLLVWGDFACFTRPELKVERVSYPVITPSAARGIFDAIFWPGDGTYWQVEKVEILRKPRFVALRRNEVKNRVDPAITIWRWATGRQPILPLYADGTQDAWGALDRGRTQRQTVALKNVRYRLHARLVSRKERCLKAADAQFQRRASAGQCFQQPYLGCREFAAYFEPDIDQVEEPFPFDLDLGLMLYDVFSLDKSEVKPSVSLFEANIRNGILEIPEYSSERVLKGQT